MSTVSGILVFVYMCLIDFLIKNVARAVARMAILGSAMLTTGQQQL